VLAIGLPLIAWGLIFNLWLCVVGGVIVVTALYGWVTEPSVDDEAPHDHGDDHDGGDHDGDEAAAEIDDAASPTDEPGAPAGDAEEALVD
jgi:cytochrome c oxidase subunit 1